MIHPTAIIGSEAKIAGNVEIGPHSVIGSAVTVAENCVIGANVVIEGEVSIGRDNRIGHGAIIGGEPQDVSFSASTRSRVEIGNDNLIREYCTIHRGTTEGSGTKIGNENFLMVGVHVGHNCVIGNKVILANNVLLGGYVMVEDQAFVGGGTTLHQNMRVGRLVMVQGSSAFGKDLPPFTLAAERNLVFGLNVIGIRRAGFSLKEREDIKAAFKLLYLSGLNLSQAIEAAAQANFGELGREFFAFVEEAKKRSVCPYRGKKDRAEAAGEL